MIRSCLDHGFVELLNISGPTHHVDTMYGVDEADIAVSARTSFGHKIGDKEYTREQDIKLLGYLYKNRHTTPFEMIEIWLHMKMPIFVARQLVRHRTVSINEVSARYTKLPYEFYIPDASVIGVKSRSNKQGRDLKIENLEADDFRSDAHLIFTNAYDAYEKALASGIPNEIARSLLPTAIYTRWLWKQDLHNLLHLLSLRMDSHAQYEIRVYASAVHEMLSVILPETMNLFNTRYPLDIS